MRNIIITSQNKMPLNKAFQAHTYAKVNLTRLKKKTALTGM